MGDLIGKLMPLAIGVAVSPIPLLAVLIMLTSQRAMKNAVTLICGWVMVIVTIGLGGLLIFIGREFKGIGGTGGHVDDVANLVVGGILLLLGVARYLRQRKGVARDSGVSRLLEIIDRIKPSNAFLLGVGTVVVNPKNILVTLSAVGLILASGLGFGNSFLALLVFVGVSTSSLALPVALCLVSPRRSADILAKWKEWLLRHNKEVVAYLLLFLGLLLMVTGLLGLLG